MLKVHVVWVLRRRLRLRVTNAVKAELKVASQQFNVKKVAQRVPEHQHRKVPYVRPLVNRNVKKLRPVAEPSPQNVVAMAQRLKPDRVEKVRPLVFRVKRTKFENKQMAKASLVRLDKVNRKPKPPVLRVKQKVKVCRQKVCLLVVVRLYQQLGAQLLVPNVAA